MRNLKATIFTLGLSLALALFVPAAKAQVSNQATQISFEQPVRVSTTVLPPGTYWFTVLDEGPASGNNQVQIKNADGTKVMAQLETESADHAQSGQETTANGVTWPTGKVVLTFAEGRKGEPISLLEWYYPGRDEGHRFVYTERRQKQLNEEKHQTLAFRPGDKINIGRSLASFE